MISLRQLDGKRVGVSLPLREPPVWIYGDARFETSGDAPQLKITFDDPTGSFDILIKEAEWTGMIEPGSARRQAEFLIRFTSAAAEA